MYKKISPAGNVYIAKSFRMGSKTSSKTVAKLGKLSDIMERNNWTETEALDWIDSEVMRLTALDQEESGTVTLTLNKNKDIPFHSLPSFRIGHLFLQRILFTLGLPEICRKISDNSKAEFDLYEILSALVFHRVLNPGSKLNAFQKIKEYNEDWDFSLSDIYRSLDLISENLTDIQSSLFKNSLKFIDRNLVSLIYDCSNFYMEVEEADSKDGLRQYGKSKENRPNPIIGMGLFTDAEGIPVRMSLFPGNLPDVSTIDKNVINELRKEFDIKQFIYSADAGIASETVKKSLEHSYFPCSYVVTESIKKMTAENQAWALGLDVSEDENWWFYRKFSPELQKMMTYKILFKDIRREKHSNTIFFKEKWVRKDNRSKREERLVVTYNLKYADYLSSLRAQHLERAIKKLETQGKRKRPTDPNRLIKETHFTKDGDEAKKVKYEVDIAKVEKEARYDGFYCISTNMEESSIDEIIAVNKNRWRIEANFRTLKLDLVSRPVHVYSEAHIKAHFMICFIALLTMRSMEKTLDFEYSGPKLLETLRSMWMFRQKDAGYSPDFERTQLTDQLMEIYNLPLSREIISKERFNQLKKRSRTKMRKLQN